MIDTMESMATSLRCALSRLIMSCSSLFSLYLATQLVVLRSLASFSTPSNFYNIH